MKQALPVKIKKVLIVSEFEQVMVQHQISVSRTVSFASAQKENNSIVTKTKTNNPFSNSGPKTITL